jgi:acyl carrier protein
MVDERNIVDTLLEVINDIKKTGFSADTVEMDFYLGGDLGVDSREMLEVWFDVEQKLGIRVHDYEKRDIYTIGDVVNRIKEKMAEAA